MLNWMLFVTLGMFMFNHANAEYPGVRLILTSKALDYVSSLIIPLLEKEVLDLEDKIPDVSDDAEIMLIGTIQYNISNINIEEFSIKSSTVSSDTDGITLQLSNIALRSECNWKYMMEYWPYFGDSGRVEIGIKNGAVKLSGSVTKSEKGHPVVKTTKCEVLLPKPSIDVHGETRWINWIYGLFQSKLEDVLRRSLISMICDNVHANVIQLNSAISTYPLYKEIDNFTIMYGLLSDPVFSSNQNQFDLEGEVMTTVSDDAPLQSTKLPAVESSDSMIHLLLTDKLFTTAVIAAIHSDLLHYKITADQLPSDSPLHLNTRFFKHTIPKLFKQFPDLAVALDINISNYKEINLNLAGVHISLLGDLLLQVIQQDNTTFDAFSVELETHCTLEVDILQTNDRPTVVLEATDLQTTLGRLTSSIGDFETAALKRALNGISLPLMFIINDYGRKGFIIPSIDRMSFIDPSIAFKKDCVQVSMDFEYSLNNTV